MAHSHILVGASTSPAPLVVRHITPSDLLHALARGLDDFAAMPSHALFLCVIYPERLRSDGPRLPGPQRPPSNPYHHKIKVSGEITVD